MSDELIEKKIKKLVAAAKERAKRKGLQFTLTADELLPAPILCPVSGVALEYWSPVRSRASASLDRVNSEMGYVRRNVAIISWRANELKSDATPAGLRWVSSMMAHKPQGLQLAAVRGAPASLSWIGHALGTELGFGEAAAGVVQIGAAMGFEVKEAVTDEELVEQARRLRWLANVIKKEATQAEVDEIARYAKERFLARHKHHEVPHGVFVGFSEESNAYHPHHRSLEDPVDGGIESVP